MLTQCSLRIDSAASQTVRLSRMLPPVPDRINQAIDALPASLRESTRRWFGRLVEGGYDGALPETLVPLVAVSEFAATWLLRNPAWIDTLGARLDQRPAVAFPAAGDLDDTALKRALRQWRHQCLIHLLWREIVISPPVSETIADISALAETLVQAAADQTSTAMQARYGVVMDGDGQVSEPMVLGMGKLGGRELNFSSDIDIIFLYSTSGESNGDRALSAQEYFTRYARQVVSLLDDVTEDGFVFRVDTRLRPFGDSGPLVSSFASFESYLLSHGRDWERYAYVKARVIGRHTAASTIEELFQQMISPFVYRRYLDFGVFDALREMHAMIAAEVRRKELADNVKLGPGGIREVEFAVQSLQLVRGGRDKTLQEPTLLTVLPRLIGRDGLDSAAADRLGEAYAFLRRLENFIQALRDRQTHDLPTDPVDQDRLSLAMGFADWAALQAALSTHREAVATVFSQLAFGDSNEPGNAEQTPDFGELFANGATLEQWQAALPPSSVDDLAAPLAAFTERCARQPIDTIALQRLTRFVRQLVPRVCDAHTPGRAVARTLSVVENVVRRSAYIALLNENPAVFDRLVALCERSAYLTQQLGRYPVLLDELLDPRIYSQPSTREALTAELNERLAAVEDDSESQAEALARFQRANQFRIAAADFNGTLPLMKVSDHLTDLAEVIVDAALAMAWRDMRDRYQLTEQYAEVGGFGVIGYGKLGGLELSYGSDLDLVFLHDLGHQALATREGDAIDSGLFLSRLVRRLVHILSAQTGSGVLYEIDTRLRPDGQSGLLVSPVEAFERYQANDAWTWEHQALLRARPVAGDVTIGKAFTDIRARILTTAIDKATLRDDVRNMRKKMRQSLDKTNAEQFDLKHGVGGMGDIEFLVQYLVLREAPAHPAVFEYSDNIRQLAALASCGCLDIATASGLQTIYQRYRQHAHHLSLDDHVAIVAADDFADERETVSRLWNDILGP